MIDRYGLSASGTHSGLPIGDTVEGGLVMGFKCIENLGGGGGGDGRGGSGRGPGGPGGGAGTTEEAARRQAQTLNDNGKIAAKFGMKMIVHKHSQEFAPLADKPNLRQYDILLSETDPQYVAMQLDIGWASVAGQTGHPRHVQKIPAASNAGASKMPRVSSISPPT